MIVHFRCTATEDIFFGHRSAKFPMDMHGAAIRKLLMLETARFLMDLRIPPGNRLEALYGNRRGQYSIRINDQWRVCFEFRDGNAYEVEIVDYH
jgi:proteic killer suppression protein